MRAFGSLAFVLATLAVGFLLDAEGAGSLFWVYIPFLIGTVVVTATIPRSGDQPLGQPPCAVPASSWRRRGSRCSSVGFTVVWASLAAVNAFYSIQVVALGGSTGLVGIAWAIGASIEIPIMYAFPRIGRRIGTERLVVIGSLAFALRALLASVIADPIALVLVAPLEGIGFACVFVGGVTVLAAWAPAGLQGTAQGLFAGRQRAGHDRRLGGSAACSAGSLRIPRLFWSGGRPQPRRDRDRGGGVAGPTESKPNPSTGVTDGTASRSAVYGDRRHHRIEEDPSMRHVRPIVVTLLALGMAVSAAGSVLAKGEAAQLTLDEPLPIDAPPGSEVEIAWTLGVMVGDGTTQPFSAQGVFVRLTPASGPPVEVVARQDRSGHYIASVTVPPGGLGAVAIGLQGTACLENGECYARTRSS